MSAHETVVVSREMEAVAEQQAEHSSKREARLFLLLSIFMPLFRLISSIH